MKKLFIATHNDTSGFFMCNTGKNSYSTGDDYFVITNNLRADEVPEQCQDSSDTAYLIAGLLNAYYNDVDVSGWDPVEVSRLGIPDNKPVTKKEDNSLPF